jgi:general secretion pathway protein A
MYLDFFKFKKNPFHITPDPDFLFLSRSHREASASIFYGIEERKGFVAVTGEVGVGKTTILRSYLEGTDPEKIKIVYIFNAALSFDRLLKQIASELGIPVDDQATSDLVDSLFHFLIDEYKNDRNIVLIIDEAQNMPVGTLERLRMLSNLETSQDKLLQIILVGQPEFEEKLNLPELRQLKQRIAIRCRIDALTREESLAYIQHRLMKASLFHNQVFTKDVLKRIVQEAKGIPRIINILCDNALITAFGYQRNPVDKKILKEVIKDFQGGKSRSSFRWKFVWIPVLTVFLGLVVFVSRDLMPPKEIQGARTEILNDPAEAPAQQPAMHSQDLPRGKVEPPRAPAVSETKPPIEPAGSPVRDKKTTESVIPEAPASDRVERPAGSPAISSQDLARGKAEPAPVVSETKPPAETAGGIARDKKATESTFPETPASDRVDTPTGLPAMRPQELVSDKFSGIKPESASTPVQPSVQTQEVSPIESQAPKEALPIRVVKKGDSVSRLLVDAYGRVDDDLLRTFKELNPQIKDINIIKQGEELVLPKLQQKH